MKIKYRTVFLALCCIETLLTAGVVMGWPSYAQILEDEGVYHELCSDPNVDTCPEQQQKMVEIFYAGSICVVLCLVVTGPILDRFGPRTATMSSLGVFILGCGFLVASHKKLIDGFAFGYSLLGFAGVGIQSSSLCVANLFPSHAPFIIGLLIALFNAGSAVLILFFELHVHFGISSVMWWGLYAALVAFLGIPSLLLFPTRQFINGQAEKFVDLSLWDALKTFSLVHKNFRTIWMRKAIDDEEVHEEQPTASVEMGDMKSLSEIEEEGKTEKVANGGEVPHEQDVQQMDSTAVEGQAKEDGASNEGESKSESVEGEDDHGKKKHKKHKKEHRQKLIDEDEGEERVEETEPERAEDETLDENNDDGVETPEPQAEPSAKKESEDAKKKKDDEVAVAIPSFKLTDAEAMKERLKRLPELSFWRQMACPEYWLPVLWMTIMMLRSNFLNGTVHLFLVELGDTIDDDYFYTRFFTSFWAFSSLVEWTGGAILNKKGFTFYYALTNTMSIIYGVVLCIPILPIQPIAFVNAILQRQWCYGCVMAYLPHIFGYKNFGKLLAGFGLACAAGSVLQYALTPLVFGPLHGSFIPLHIAFLVISLPFCYISWFNLKRDRGFELLYAERGTKPQSLH